MTSDDPVSVFKILDLIYFQFSTFPKVGYDRRVRPEYGGEPVFVKVSLYVLSVEEINELFMDFTFDMYFRLDSVLVVVVVVLMAVFVTNNDIVP